MKVAWAFLFLCVSLCAARAEEAWQSALEQMPLQGHPSQLNETNCVHLLLASFKSNTIVKGLVFMPGATDDLYLSRRVQADLTNSASISVLDAIEALTNQTPLRVEFRPPLLLLHLETESVEPNYKVEDQATAQKLKMTRFKPYQCFEDSEWDDVQPVLTWSLKLDIRPWRYRSDSFHFYRQNFAAWGLSGWEAIEAVSLASKTKFTVSRKRVVFTVDSGVR